MGFLLDTNIVSELRKSTPDKHVRTWIDGVSASSLYLSALVIGELRQGVERLRPRDPFQAGILERWLEQVASGFHDRILPVTPDVAEEWGRLNARGPLPVIDGLLAATAKIHGLTLVTRNVADVANCGVAVLNPFTA